MNNFNTKNLDKTQCRCCVLSELQEAIEELDLPDIFSREITKNVRKRKINSKSHRVASEKLHVTDART